MNKNKDIVEQTLLYDFYGELLTEHQRRIYQEVVFDDYSISEVAKDEGISRQSVSDMIRRIDEALCGYEEKLGLIKQFDDTKKTIKKISTLIKKYKSDHNETHIDKIDILIQGLLK